MGIGDFAGAVGLSVSALRFYDRVGVLAPAEVDVRTGYRRYTVEQLEAGRLVARLRRVGVGVADLRMLIGARGDAQLVSGVLDRHLERLEAGLRDARTELERIQSMLGLPPEASGQSGGGLVTVFEMAAADLVRAVDAVMFALPDDGTDPDLELVVFELEAETVSLFATDRYRMATCTVPVLAQAGESSASFAISAADVCRGRDVVSGDNVSGDGVIELSVADISLTMAVHGEPVALMGIVPGPVLDLKHLHHPSSDAQRLSADSAGLVSMLSDDAWSVSDELTGVRVVFLAEDPTSKGEVTLVRADHSSASNAVPVNARYLLEAINAGPKGRVDLSLRRQHPLAIRFGDDSSTTSIVMPRRG